MPSQMAIALTTSFLQMETDFPDVLGNDKGTYFVEVQLRTIAQDPGPVWSIK